MSYSGRVGFLDVIILSDSLYNVSQARPTSQFTWFTVRLHINSSRKFACVRQPTHKLAFSSLAWKFNANQINLPWLLSN